MNAASKAFKPHSDEYSKSSGFSRSSFGTLAEAYRPFKTRILVALALGFFSRFTILANANIIGYWVDSFCEVNCRPRPGIFRDFGSEDYIGLLSIMTGVGFLLTLTFRVYFSRLSAYAVSRIYDEVTIRTSRYPLGFFDSTPTGRIITRFSSDYGNVFRLFGGPLAEFCSIVFDLSSMVLLITLASPYFLIFVVFTSFLNYIIYRFNRSKLRSARRELSASRSPSIAHFAETTQGASIIRIYQKEETFKERFEILDRYYLKNRIATVAKLLGFSFQMNSLSSLLFLIIGLSSIFMIHHNLVSVGSVGVAFGFVALSGNTLQMFFEWLTQLEEAMVGVERLDQYLRNPLERGSSLPSNTEFRQTDHKIFSITEETSVRNVRLTLGKSASIQVRNLQFRYSEATPWILKNIDFDVAAGEKIGIVGRTGSGKTSLISALFYLYPINEGFVSIEHKLPSFMLPTTTTQYPNLIGFDLNVYRKTLSLIPQDPVLFIGTLRMNLDFQNEFEDEKLLEVLHRVGLREWVVAQPEKLNYQIDEKGKNLSLGERQLICMARCLLQDSPIVIMDEATSSVDPQSEEIMVRATEEFFKDRTQIIIAHRLSTLEKCDRILWLDQGKIKKFGPTREILADLSVNY